MRVHVCGREGVKAKPSAACQSLFRWFWGLNEGRGLEEMTMKPWLMMILLVNLGASASVAQTKVLVIEGQPKADVVRSFGLIPESTPNAANNRAQLQEELDSGAPIYPWFFPGAPGAHQPYYFDTTLEILFDSGRAWLGVGGVQRALSAEPTRGSMLSNRAISFGTLFDGSTKTATALLASPTVLVLPTDSTGRTVVDQDEFNSVKITGGTNFIPGWYGIESVDTENNTWTLDRACVSGGNGSAMTGEYCPELVRNRGVGTSHKGLWFSGKRVDGDSRGGQVCYHVAPSSPGAGGTGTGTTGKHHFENCTFSNYQTAILCGRHMAHAYSEPTGSYAGDADNHADHLTLVNVRCDKIGTLLYLRNNQSLAHNLYGIKMHSCDGEVVYAEAGGQVQIDGLHITAGETATSASHRIFRVGNRFDYQRAMLACRGFSFDAPTPNPQLIKTDSDIGTDVNREVTAHFDSGVISKAADALDVPLVDVKGPCNIHISNTLWIHDDALLLKVGTGAAAGEKPLVILTNCRLRTTGSDPHVVVDEGSDPGCTVVFIGCTNRDGDLFPYEEYTVPAP